MREQLTELTTTASPLPSVEATPYVGPQPFQRHDSGRFFGRTQETNQLLSLVIAHRVTVLYAPSGAGKTSLLNAALIPRLEEKGLEVLPPTRVLGPAETADLDIQNIYTYQALSRLEGEEISPRNLANCTISDYLGDQPVFLDKYGLAAPRVLIFDQFEEFFTAYPAHWQERDGFFQQLQDALESEPLLRIVFSLREDYVAQLEPYARFMPDNLRHRFRLERMTPEAALEAIRGPLRNTSRTFTDEAAEKLVDELRKIQVESATGTVTAVGRYIEPVQLQVVCQNLWQSLPTHITTITEKELETYGDVTQALSQFYESALQDTVRQPGIHVKENDLRDWFEKQLITPAGTRSLLFQDNESGLTGGIPNPVVNHLDWEHHIIRGEFRSGSRWYELTHDRFIDPIIEANQHWREQVRRRRLQQLGAGVVITIAFLVCILLATATQDYLSDLNAGATEEVMVSTLQAESIEASETQAAVAQQLAAATAAEQTRIIDQQATATVIAFQQATATALAGIVISVSEEEAVANPDLYLARAGSLFPTWTAEERLQSLTTLTQYDEEAYTIGAIELFFSLSSAEQEELIDTASNQESLSPIAFFEQNFPMLAAAEQLQTLAYFVQSDNSTISSRATVIFQNLDPADQEEIFKSSAEVEPEEFISLVEFLLPVGQRLTGHRLSVLAVAFSPDGRWLASGSEDETIRLWDLDDLTAEPIILSGHEEGVWSVDFSPDGQWLASGGFDQTVRLWDMNKIGADPVILSGHRGWVRSVAFSPDGQLLASGGSDRTIRLWSMDNAADDPVTLSGHTSGVWSVAFSPDGEWLASSSEDQTVRLWDLSALAANPVVLSGHEDSVLAVAFSPDGRRLASGSVDQTVRVWNLSDSDTDPVILSGHEDGVWAVAFSRDGQLLASSSEDGEIRLWNVSATITPNYSITGHQLGVWSLAFSRDGRWLASGSVDRTIRLWNLALNDVVQESLCNNQTIVQYLIENLGQYPDSILNPLQPNCIFQMTVWPTEARQINQAFGENPEYYVQFGLPGHEGLDIQAPEGSNIFAVADGVVSRVRDESENHIYGNAIYIQHHGGYRTVYGNLQEVFVEVGDEVKAGDIIALAGSTGNSFGGGFTHFGLYLDGATNAGETSYPFDIIDPTPFLTPLLTEQ